jgi:hypothetical protein
LGGLLERTAGGDRMSGTVTFPGREEILDHMASIAREAGDRRLEGKMTREQHARIIAYVDSVITEFGVTWDDLNGRTVTA